MTALHVPLPAHYDEGAHATAVVNAYVRAAMQPGHWIERFLHAPPARLAGLLGLVVGDHAAQLRELRGLDAAAQITATLRAEGLPIDDVPFADVTAARCLVATLNGDGDFVQDVLLALASARGPDAVADAFVAAVDQFAATVRVAERLHAEEEPA